MNLLYSKLKETASAILPVVVIVTILNFTLVPLGTVTFVRFVVASIFVIIGLSLFLVGVELGVTPLGDYTGQTIVKSNKLWIILGSGLILGFFIAFAEPGLLVFGNQVSFVTQGQLKAMLIVVLVSIGIAVMASLGFLRIIYNLKFSIIMVSIYGVILIISNFVSAEYLGIAFDAAGVVTGVVAVPFLLALSLGLSKLKKDSVSSENDSFGLVAISSSGAILMLLILGVINKNINFSDVVNPTPGSSNKIFAPFGAIFAETLKSSFLALLPMVVVLIVLQIFVLKLPKRSFARIAKGFVYALLGLIIFLVGVDGSFMDVGSQLGTALVNLDAKIIVIVVAFFIGFLTIMAEPAVSILTHQVEDVTSGFVKRKVVLYTIGVGVGVSTALATVKILVPSLELWHLLLPGYIIAFTLMFFAPKLFVGIAFDAGLVTTGPLTATFTLSFVQGIANAYPLANVVRDGFGMVALVGISPILSLQVLGIIYTIKTKKRGVKYEKS